MTDSTEEKTIEKFLLGALPESKRLRFEEKFIGDGEFFERIKAIEDELIERYVRGWMNESERRTFEENYLATEKRRARIFFAQKFIETFSGKENPENNFASEKTGTKTGMGKKGFRKRLEDFFRELKIAPVKASAGALAAVLAIAFAAFLSTVFLERIIFRERNPETSERIEPNEKKDLEIPGFSPNDASRNSAPKDRNEPKTPGGEEKAAAQNIAPSESAGEETQARQPSEKENSLNRKKSVNQRKSPNRKTSPNAENPSRANNNSPPAKNPVRESPAAPAEPFLELFSGTLRSGGGAEKSGDSVLNLPKKASRPRLRLNLARDAEGSYRNFQAHLVDADGRRIYTWTNLRARNAGIELFIPAEFLEIGGDFRIKLFGKNSAGADESVADFQFRVDVSR